MGGPWRGEDAEDATHMFSPNFAQPPNVEGGGIGGGGGAVGRG